MRTEKTSFNGRKGINTKETSSDRGDKMSTAWPFAPTPQGEGPGPGSGWPG